MNAAKVIAMVPNKAGLLVLGVVLWCAGVSAQQSSSITPPEHNELRRELAKAQAERQRVAREKQADAQEFQTYRVKTQERFEAAEKEVATVNETITQIKLQSDSLEAIQNSLTLQKSNLAASMDAARTQLVLACDSVLVTTAGFPPLETEKLRSALGFLRSELLSATVNADEGMNRLVAVLRDMHETTQSIQVTQGSSPLKDINGTVYRLRYGALFEGVVDETGTRCALWTGNDAHGNGRWIVQSDPTVARELLAAAQLRSGKAVPALVTLPIVYALDNRQEENK